ncbi:class I SAM-dependent methyltransferase [Spirosoma flavum]|uniref:Class I SAM-dependent methyltransferase n=1 Tax=Spirosoma flavum TaxID=2048557 RepID=A0ABW6AJ20_9BACT
MVAKTSTSGDFNWIAPVYDALAFTVFGHKLQRAQLVFLDQIPTATSVLIVGGGTGWLLEQVLLRCQPKRVVYLETSTQMLARASRRMVHKSLLGSVEFRLGDETTLLPGEPFDVIITPFVLDLFSETTLQVNFIPQLLSVLKPTGQWFVTDFVQTDSWWQKALLWSMIRFFGLTAGIRVGALADWQQCMARAGLTLRARKPQVGGMVSTEVWKR